MKKRNIMIGPEIGAAGGISSVASLYKKNGFFEHLDIDYWPSWVEGSKFTKILIFLDTLKKLIVNLNKNNVATVHFHSASKSSFVRKSLLAFPVFIFRVPVIFHIHSGAFFVDFNRAPPICKKWIVFTLNKSSSVIVLSNFFKKKADLIVRDPRKVEVVLNPAALNSLTLASKKIRDDKSLNLLFLGNLTSNKGFFDLLKILRELNAQGIKANVRCGGAGDRKVVHAAILDHGVADCVELLGWINADQRNREFEMADAYILPSYFEGQPMAILEAMMAEVLVIATETGGIPDIVQHNKTGYLAKPGDHSAFVRILANLYANKSLGTILVANAKSYVCENHRPECILISLTAIYRRIGAL